MDIYRIENHNQAYDIWRQRAVSRKTLVHIDAHIDFAWIPDGDIRNMFSASTPSEFNALLNKKHTWNIFGKKPRALFHIGNYVYPALQEGIVNRVYWVVPDPIWHTASGRSLIKKILMVLQAGNPGACGPLAVRADRIEVSFMGVAVTALARAALPVFEEEVLLDIDTDYFVTDSLQGVPPYFTGSRRLPWIWPEELAQTIKNKHIISPITTIAYSVEGGFTPLAYKFLGDETAGFLKGDADICSQTRARFRNSIALYAAGRSIQARIALERTACEGSLYEAPQRYLLARMYKECDNYQKAQCCMQDAVRLDASYATAYNNAALRLRAQGKHAQALCECEFMQDTFPDEYLYRLLRADVLLDAGKLTEALAEYEQVLTHNSHVEAVWAAAGRVLYHQKKYQRAIEYCRRGVADGGNAQSFYWLGMACARAQKIDEAIQYLQRSVTQGMRTADVYFQLAGLFAARKNFYKVQEKFLCGIQAFFSQNVA